MSQLDIHSSSISIDKEQAALCGLWEILGPVDDVRCYRNGEESTVPQAFISFVMPLRKACRGSGGNTAPVNIRSTAKHDTLRGGRVENVGFQSQLVILSGMISFLKWMSILSAADKTNTQQRRKNSRVTGKQEIWLGLGWNCQLYICGCTYVYSPRMH